MQYINHRITKVEKDLQDHQSNRPPITHISPLNHVPLYSCADTKIGDTQWTLKSGMYNKLLK